MPRTPSPSNASDDTRRILDAIRRIVQELRVSSRAAERGLDLSGAQLFVLRQLLDGESLSINELAARTFTHQSSVSVVVQRLVSKSLVLRQRSPRDGRRIELSLTARGRKLLRTSPPLAQEKLITAINTMPGPGRAALAASLDQLIATAGLDGQSPALFFEDGAPVKPKRAKR